MEDGPLTNYELRQRQKLIDHDNMFQYYLDENIWHDVEDTWDAKWGELLRGVDPD